MTMAASRALPYLSLATGFLVFSTFFSTVFAQQTPAEAQEVDWLELGMGLFGGLALFLAAIGLYGAVNFSVSSRTREIGIRMSIGALPREVLLQFLVEALVLSLVGGLVGIVLALVGSYALAQAMGIPFIFDLQINLVAFAFSAAVGVVFGFAPARRAARLDPIDALRFE